MLNITDSFISDICMSSTTYKKGLDYYKNGRIKSLKLIDSQNVIMGTVRGAHDYKIKITFNDDGDITDCSCTCPSAAPFYWGQCKHVAAVLMHLKWLEDNGRFSDITARRNARALFDLFQYKSYNKTPVNLQIIFEHDEGFMDRYGSCSLLSFKIGLERLYIVKSIPKLLMHIEENNPLEFGRKFTFIPDSHSFSDEDKKLISFMQEVLEVSTPAYYYNQYRENYGYNANLFQEKYMILTPRLVKRFFKLMDGYEFDAVINGKAIDDIKVVKDELPVSLSFDSTDDNLILDLKLDDDIYPITPDFEYVLVNDTIYNIPESQRHYISPFIKVLNNKKDHHFIFGKDNKDKFVSEILPYANKIGKVTINSEVEKMFVKEEFRPEVYFDKAGKGIKARLKFFYGQYAIDLINTASGKMQLTDKKDGERIILRDLEAEQRIIDIFEKYKFTINENEAVLNNEDRIYNFYCNGISELTSLAAVFYSEDFKIVIRDKASYSAGVRLSNQTDFLDFSFEIADVDKGELERFFASLREKKKYFRLRDGSFMNLDSDELQRLSELVEGLGIRGKDLNQQSIKIPKYRALYLNNKLNQSGAAKIYENSDYLQLVKDIKEPGEINIEIPVNLKPILRGYQHVGVKWLKTLANYGFGGILADDMGLGKTLQVLTLLLMEKESGNQGGLPSIVIAPTSLIYNWEAEVDKFVPELRTLVISGTKDERLSLFNQVSDYDLVITSYPLIRRDAVEYSDVEFKYCIIDEAQHIKNPGSLAAKAVKSIKAQKRFALTGTPMENSLTELWSIFDFIMPGYLFTHSKFMSRFERPIIKNQSNETLEDLSFHISPFILRRLKTDVLTELPEKIENKVIAELTEDQKKIYLAYLAQAKHEIQSEIKNSGYENSQIKILSVLTRLRQISCHPGMFIEDYKGESGKLQLLEELVSDAVLGGHRILLFSQFTSMLKIIHGLLSSLNINTFYLDGSTKALERGRLVKAFNEGEADVFLISLKAGGTGLNLTGADMVIHFDPWWNPAVEDQATDRAHRIGQTRVVHVLKLITKGTIEEKIENLKQQKKDLTDAVIKPGEYMISKMTQEEVMSLFEMTV